MKSNKAFSLIEVLIFVTILSVFFVIAASVTVVSLRNMKTNEHRILASHYGEQLIEWLRDQKEADWDTFKGKTDNSYCFNSVSITDWPTAGSCATNALDNIFKRDLSLSTDDSDPNQINVSIIISWQETNGSSFQVPLATVFTRWEN